jgi:GNAT superfamily N-acetyltransferase
VIRPASPDDVITLVQLERAASTAGLSHVFGPDIPFPELEVLSRWRLVFDDPRVTVVIAEVDGEPIGYAAFGDGWLRHLGLLPEWWGSGHARELHDFAVGGMTAAGAHPSYLWVLVGNHRARAFYTRLGWVDTGLREEEVFAPYPAKMQMARL